MQRRRAGCVLRRHERRVGGDQRFEGRAIVRAHSRNDRRDFRIDGRGRCFRPDLGPEVGALIDPRSQDADLVIRQRTGRRHLQSAVTVHEPLDQFAVRAVARRDDGSVVAAAQRGLPQVEAQPRLLGLEPVAGVTVLREDWPHVRVIVDDSRGRGRQGVLRERRSSRNSAHDDDEYRRGSSFGLLREQLVVIQRDARFSPFEPGRRQGKSPGPDRVYPSWK